MIKIAVVEDETIYKDQLAEYLSQYEKEQEEQFEISFYGDGDGITAEYEAQYDIILMDIQMKLVDGMTAAEEIRKKDSKVIIIFITSMPQYAVRGYEVDALDYILKPVTYFSFSQKLGKAIDKLKKKSTKYLHIPISSGVLRTEISDVYYIESQGHTLIFHTKEGTVSVYGTMKSVEEKLKDVNFSKGNKCYLINLEHVERVKDKCAVVKDEKLPLSRSGLKNFMRDLTKYWGEVE